jgi:hypothetical protein
MPVTRNSDMFVVCSFSPAQLSAVNFIKHANVKSNYNIRVQRTVSAFILPSLLLSISMPHQDTASGESHNDNLTSLTWQEIAEDSLHIVIFERVIKEFHEVEPENEEDKLPDQLLEVANTILNISSNIKVNYTNSSLLTYSNNQTIFTLVGNEPQKRFRATLWPCNIFGRRLLANI